MESAPDENNPGHASAPSFEFKDHIPLNHINNFRNIENILIEKAKQTFNKV